MAEVPHGRCDGCLRRPLSVVRLEDVGGEVRICGTFPALPGTSDNA